MVPHDVRDAAALLASMHNEPGAKRVRNCLPWSIISAVNLAAVGTQPAKNGLSSAEVWSVTTEIGLEVWEFDISQALASAGLSKSPRPLGLSRLETASVSGPGAVNGAANSDSGAPL